MIKPTNDVVLVRPDISTDIKTPSGILLVSMTETFVKATVVAIGPGRRLADGSRVRVSVEPGSRVIMAGIQGTEITIDGTSHFLLREDQILAEIAEEEVGV